MYSLGNIWGGEFAPFRGGPNGVKPHASLYRPRTLVWGQGFGVGIDLGPASAYDYRLCFKGIITHYISK